jgi:hypothetical protein
MASKGNKFILEKFISNNQLQKAQDGVETWKKQQELVRKEKAGKLKELLETPLVFKTKEEKLAEKMQQERYRTIPKDNVVVRNYNDANKFSAVARNKTDKEIADERKAVRKKSDANVLNQYSTEILDPDNWTRENLAESAQGLESKFRVSDEPNFFDDWLNPANMIGNMASNLGQAPLQAQQSDSYLPYITAIGTPLTVGALAGLGTSSNAQFINNLTNPIAGFETSIGNFAKSNFNKLKQVGKRTFTPNREVDLSGIERLSGQLRESTVPNIEEIRRAFHNSERFLSPEEIELLRVQGRGAAENYRLPPPPPIENLQAGLTGVPDTQTSFNYTTQEALDRLHAGMRLEPEHVQRLGRDYNANNLSLADSDAFGRYIIGNRGAIDLRRGAASNADNTNGWGTENWNPNAAVRRYDLDDPYAPSDPNWNTPNYVVRNRSGFKKEDLIAKADDAEKDVLANMSDDDFAKTVTKPSGQTVAYVDGPSISQMTYNTDHGRMIHSGATPMSSEEYAKIFNDNVDRLNEIIKLNNKSGVEYRVEQLYPNGQLKFVTPEQTLRVPNKGSVRAKVTDISSDPSAPYPYQVEYSTGPEHMDVEFFDTQAEAEKFMSDLKANEPEFVDVKIDAGSTQWDTPINAGRWEGEVEDIANKEYFKSIPGLNMSVTSNTVFADRMARPGTGTYKSINEFLKELNLGRVKPGFNSQTKSSFSAWDKAAKKGEAVGYYADPSLFYGVYKRKGGDTTIPYSDFQKYAMKEMGGMMYANKDAGLPHEQSMQKYLSAQNNLLDFMKRIKVVGGPVPFDEYYRENIINPRNKS